MITGSRVLLNLGFFVLLKCDNKIDREISLFNYNSKDCDKCKFDLKLVSLPTVSNYFLLRVVQKCQYCQLCILWDNSIAYQTVLPWHMLASLRLLGPYIIMLY